MRSSRLHVPTLKEVPRDADIANHQLLLRGGYIRRVAAGLYNFLPLGHRVLSKVSQIIREEMNKAGAQEILMPFVQPAELWQESGRWQAYGPEMARLKDRKGADFCLGPTHEEVIVDLVRGDVRSWRSLPLNLYQIQAKFRDEIRPRAGLLRGREFVMKDAYSFDVDSESANRTYDAMYAAYERIFTRCGLEFRPVEADTGAIGGSRSHEFQVLVDAGEDAIVSCASCGYAANVEQAELCSEPAPEMACNERDLVHTPGVKTIEEVSRFFEVSPAECLKTLLVMVDGAPVLVCVRGDHEFNDIKLKKYLSAETVRMASSDEVREILGCIPGEVGPISDKVDNIFADQALKGLGNLICGANQSEKHITGFNFGRDCVDAQFADLRLATDGDGCARCGGELKAYRGIEVGHIFYLGTKYSEAMKLNVLDKTGRDIPVVMGCYGIGVSRVVAAAAEQHHDERGICWPPQLAPFTVSLLGLQMKKEPVRQAAEEIYQLCQDANIEVLFDDRDVGAGSKFEDADLIGAPIIIAVGAKGVARGVVEVRARSGGDALETPISDCLDTVQRLLGELS